MVDVLERHGQDGSVLIRVQTRVQTSRPEPVGHLRCADDHVSGVGGGRLRDAFKEWSPSNLQSVLHAQLLSGALEHMFYSSPADQRRECLSVGVDLVADGSDVLGRLVSLEAEDRPSLGQQTDP
jgi:hypothetical protein